MFHDGLPRVTLASWSKCNSATDIGMDDLDPAAASRAVAEVAAGDGVRSKAAPKHGRSGTHKFLLVALVAGVLALTAGYWWLHRSPKVSYLTATVARGRVQRTVTASGTVNPVTTVQVGTYVSGVLQNLYCDFNTQVKAGKVCAKIDPRPYQSIVDQERAALGTSQAQLAKDQANLAFSKVIYDRDLDLLHRQIVSQETVDTALNAYEQARSQIALDQASIAQHRATLSAAQVNLTYTDIVSPVDGTVVSRNVTQGQTVAASFQTPTLFLIATDLTQMQVDTNVSESDIGNLAVGNKVLFTVEAYPDRTFSGQVVQVRQAPQSIQNVITYDAVVGVPNPQLLLMPGMTAAVRIVTAERDNVLRVPDQALRYTPGGPARAAKDEPGADAAHAVTATDTRALRVQGVVWRLQSGKPVRVPLEIGLDDDAYTEVLNGTLAVGDVIVVGESGGTGAAANAPRMPHL
jgi:HlyD family secretion protein